MDPGPTYSKFISPHFSARLPHRVVMLESGFGQGNFGESRKMIEELAAQFRINGLFEVIVPTDVRLRSQADNLLEGKFDEREIAKIARQFSADAVVLVRVNQLQAHAPMRASLTMTMIDSHETIVTFAVDGNWDLADSNTNYQFTQYYGAEVNQMQGPGDLHFHSPNSLFRFAAAQIADEIRVSIR